MWEKLISIVVPVYNVEAYLLDCVKSIQAQSYKNIEIILVDDGSTDTSGRICDDIKAADPRVIVIHKENGGLASARNVGIEIAKGDYIGFVDSDDWIESNMYEKLLAACLDNDVRMSCCGRIEVFGDKYKRKKYFFENEQLWDAQEMIGRMLVYAGCDSSACDKLFEKSLICNFRFPIGKLHEDIFIMYKIIQEAGRIVHIGDAVYNYRQRNGGITHSEFSVKKMDLVDAVEQVWNDLKDKYPEQKEQQQFFCVTNLMIVILLLRNTPNYRHRYKKEYSRLMLLYKKHGKGFLHNKYGNMKERVKYVLIPIHLTNTYLFIKGCFYKIVK